MGEGDGRRSTTAETVTVAGVGEGEGAGTGTREEPTKVEGGGRGAKLGEGEGAGSRSGKRVPVLPNEKEERVEIRIGGAAVAFARSWLFWMLCWNRPRPLLEPGLKSRCWRRVTILLVSPSKLMPLPSLGWRAMPPSRRACSASSSGRGALPRVLLRVRPRALGALDALGAENLPPPDALRAN